MGRVLIVDDAMFMRQTVAKLVKELGHEVVGMGGNGIEGIKLYKELQPDLVTMDITMPEMDGLEALKKIKVSYPQAKIVMVSAMGQQPIVIDAIQNGAMGFIVKPFTRDTVSAAISKYL